ncbi:MAG: hypothetical protein VSS75_020370, partial [Candidatus Parabeggiatoa sp.]|nr:hypothetical protein [Candidatus Parabeggiatoa sp.]
MLLVNIGIMASLYIGARLFEHHSDKKSTDNIKENTEQGIEKEAHDHHLKVSGEAMGLSVISYIYPPLRLFNVGVIAYTTFPILKQAEKSLLEERRIKNDLLTSLVSIMSIAMGQYFAAALEAWVYHFGCKMINKSQDTSTKMLINVFEQQPSKVWLLKDRQEIETPLESLNIDDIVVVKAGDIVPIDGTISEGMAMIDQHALTGEAMPAEKRIGVLVFAATIGVSGCIYIKVEKTGVETTVAKLGEILSHTADFKTSLQLKGEKWSDKV